MNDVAKFEPAIFATSRAVFSLRMLKYFFCWLMLWQDNMVGDSKMQLGELIGSIPGTNTVEILCILIALVVIWERSLSHDFTIRRSYFSEPMLLILAAFFLSWTRGCFLKQQFAPMLEAHEAFAWPLAFFVINNAFRDPEDRTMLWKILMLAVIPKAIEGLEVYLFSKDDHKLWGVVQLWRDGYLLGIGAVSTMLLLHYRGVAMKRVKYAMLLATPFLGFTFIMSYRRTFLVGAVCSALAMFVTLPRDRRKKHFLVLGAFIGTLTIFIFAISPVSVLARLSGIIDPSGEGSAYIRLMEYPNVIQNILHHPILGVPVGTEWKVYFRMPTSAVYTTLGTHNAYFYWQLRAGIAGTIAFFWLMGRMWKTALINYALRKDEEDFLFGQFGIHLLILYQMACFFGLLYGDDMPTMMAVIIVVFQLQAKHVTGRSNFRGVALWDTVRQKKLVFTEKAKERYGLRRPPVLAIENDG